MGLTRERIKGKDLAKCGVATHFVPTDKLESLRKVIIEKVNEDTELPHLQEIVKEFSEIVYNPEEFSFPKYDEIKRTFLVDSLEELMNRLSSLIENGSTEEMEWAKKCINEINSASPISLVVTLEQIKRGMHIKTLEEALNLEAQLIAAYV
jgi:3-hydroxyisobutyryl-CoA hydrolase